MAEKGKKNDESEKFVNAELNVDLRCNCVGCIRRIRNACLSIHGVTTVKEDVSANKLYVSGIFDPVKLIDRIQSRNPKKKVELVSPAPPKKDGKKNGDPEAKSKTEQEKSKNEKEPAVKTVVLKMAWHCEGCTHKIHKLIYTYKGVQKVQMDKAKELITVSTIDEPKQLAEFLEKKLRRTVQIVTEKKEREKEKDEDKKQKQKEGGKKGKGEEQSKDPKMEYFMVGGGYGYREAASGNLVDVFYAPQLFSEDNATGCSIM